MPNPVPRLAVLLGTLCLLACGTPTSPSTMDAALADVSDAAVDTGPPNPAQPTGPGSNARLLDDLCGARSSSGPAWSWIPWRGDPVRALRHMAPGDFEGVHVVPEQAVRVERLRLFVKGGAGGAVRVRLVPDYGRSQPEVTTDLIAPIDVTWTADGWIDLPLGHPVDLHPAHHAWLLVEHVSEPMGMAYAPSALTDYGSMYRSQYAIDQNAMDPSSDSTFQWFPMGDATGARFEFMAEVHGRTICPREAAPWFTPVTNDAGVAIASGDTNWIDVDGDGWDDVAGIGGTAPAQGPRVFRNRHDGTFEPWTERAGLDAVTGAIAIWGDLDDDGDTDAYVGAYVDGVGPFDPPFRSTVYTQGADGRFSRVASDLEPAGPTAAGALGDCDGDGRLDLWVGQWLRQYPRNAAPDFFFRGLGNGRFENVSTAMGVGARDNRPTYGVSMVDWDDDGDLDVFVANYGGSANDAWKNDGRGHFTNVARTLGFDSDGQGSAGTSFGHAFADYDNDGDLDAYETNIGHPRYDDVGTDHSRLLRNRGAPAFAFDDAAADAGLLYVEGDIGAAWGDMDDDGDLDLYVATTYPFEFSRLYRQEADHTFTDVTYVSGTQTTINGRASWSDYDRDGDLDLLTQDRGNLVLFRNDLPRAGRHWIQLRLARTGLNTAAVGARIRVLSAGGRTQRRDVAIGQSHHGVHASPWQHVGLGTDAAPVDVEVRWPDGSVVTYRGLAVDRRWRLVQGSTPVES